MGNMIFHMKTIWQQLITLKKNFQSFSKDNSTLRNMYLNEFHPNKWNELNEKQRNDHSLYICNSCSVNFMIEQARFPILSNKYKSEANENLCFNVNNIKIKSTGLLKDITNDVYNNINKVFIKKTGVRFNDALVKVKGTKLQKMKSKIEKKKDLRQLYRKQKEFHAHQLNKTAIVRYVTVVRATFLIKTCLV